MVLVVVGAAVSPQGEPLEPRPPDAAWTATADPGRATGVWVLGDRPVVAAADGLTALDPVSGEPAWTVPLDDPACTATDQTLTCVHGEGENASIATIDPTGESTDEPFPDADVAAAVDDDLIVAGNTTERPWFGRFTATDRDSPPEPVWQQEHDDAHLLGQRWHEATISQGIATVSSGGRDGADDGTGGWEPGVGLAADLETGEPRPTVMRAFGGASISSIAPGTDEWSQVVMPLTGPELAVPGHPEMVVTGRGAFEAYGGDRVAEWLGEPLITAGDDVIIAGLQPGASPTLEELAMRAERLDVRTGESQWTLDRHEIVSCPCTTSSDTVVLAESTYRGTEQFHSTPLGLLGIDLDTGRHRWTLPISTAPDAIAAGANQVYVLTDGTLTAYEDR